MAALLDIDTKAAYYSGDQPPVYSDRGRILCVWIHDSVISLKDMPRINDELLDIVVYLYPSKACAENGEQLGGSGFLVLVSSEIHTAQAYVYAVTNRHVVEHGASVIRFNTKAGGSDVPALDGNWETHPEGDDVAAIFIGGIDPASEYKHLAISNEEFLTQEIIEREAIGPGEDVFMIGRFIGHDGKQRNLPFSRLIISLAFQVGAQKIIVCGWPDASHYAAKVFGKSTGLQSKREDKSRRLNYPNYSGEDSRRLTTGDRGARAPGRAEANRNRRAQVCIPESGRELQTEYRRKAKAARNEKTSHQKIKVKFNPGGQR